MSDPVGNPEDRFSRVAAHLVHARRMTTSCVYFYGALCCTFCHTWPLYGLGIFKESLTFLGV